LTPQVPLTNRLTRRGRAGGYTRPPMASPLPLASPDDPRLDKAVARALSACRVPSDWGPTVRDLAVGKTKGSTLRCCGSGCRPCVQDIKRATVHTLTSLQSDEPFDESVTGLRLRARGRSLFRRLKRKG
jgi:hypothetical protein